MLFPSQTMLSTCSISQPSHPWARRLLTKTNFTKFSVKFFFSNFFLGFLILQPIWDMPAKFFDFFLNILQVHLFPSQTMHRSPVAQEACVSVNQKLQIETFSKVVNYKKKTLFRQLVQFESFFSRLKNDLFFIYFCHKNKSLFYILQVHLFPSQTMLSTCSIAAQSPRRLFTKKNSQNFP
jgi:hypothetical protein